MLHLVKDSNVQMHSRLLFLRFMQDMVIKMRFFFLIFEVTHQDYMRLVYFYNKRE